MQRATKGELRKFLGAFSPEIAKVALRARAFVLEEAPLAHELVADDRDTVVFRYAFTERPGDAFCRIAIHSESVISGSSRTTCGSNRSTTCACRASGACCARR